MEESGSGSRILNNYEITNALASLSASGGRKLARRLNARIDGIGVASTLEITASESMRVMRSLESSLSDPFYGQQNELGARGLLHKFEESGFQMGSKSIRLQKILRRVFSKF